MILWVLGGDARSRFAAEYLQKSGFCVQTHGVPESTDSPLPQVFSDIVLPFPSFHGTNLRGTSSLSAQDVLHRTNERTNIFGGQFGAFREVFEALGANVYDLYGAEPMTTQNAVATAEGAICLAIEHSDIALHGANVLVIGFGRCGKALAERLRALHCRLTVSARSPCDLALAEAMGYRAEETAVWRHGLQYDYIFNTVPSSVFTEAQLASIPKNCLIIELASEPGCIVPEFRRHLNYRLAPGLPGRFSPKSAGIFYAQNIIRILEKEGFH